MSTNMNLWLVCFLSVLLAVTASPERCPEKCKCTQLEAECTSLDTRFDLEIEKLKIVRNPNLKLSFEVLKNLGLESVLFLEIHDSVITELHKDAFVGIPLNEIVIRNSVVPEIPRLLFEWLPELRSVKFNNNTLKNFQGIQSNSVHDLVLQNCGIKKIEYACKNCTQLSSLDLSYNQIEMITSIYPSRVNNLNLSHNKIRNINFDINNNLEIVDLSYNPIATITGDSEMEKLIMKSCELKDLDFTEDFSRLVHLDVSDNKITQLDAEVFGNLPELQFLSLNNNGLRKLDNDVFRLNHRLSTLILDGNLLTTLPQFISDESIIPLELLSCNNCGIKQLREDTFKYTPTITTISLGNNQLTQIPEKLFQYVPSLVKLYLNNNLLTRIEKNTFKRNSNLEVLVLLGNPLKSVDPVIFANNRVLNDLDLNNCSLTKLWSSTQTKIRSLSILRVKNNLIESITREELDVANNVDTLLLEGNDFDCNKTNVIQKWIKLFNVDVSENGEPGFQWNDCDADIYDISYDDDEEDDDKFYENNDDYASDFTQKPLIPITDEDDQFTEDVRFVTSVDSRFNKEQPRREIIVFLLPTLVFVLTALIVLVFTVSAILCVLYKRNKKPNAPQINIIPWSSTPKIKKHSGSVYRPLSEEKIPV